MVSLHAQQNDWKKEKTKNYSMLLELWIGIITLENCLALSVKAQHVHILWPSSTPAFIPNRNACFSLEDTYKTVTAGLSLKASNWKLSKCPSKIEWINVIYSHRTDSYGNEQITTICNNRGESYNHTKWK